MKIQEVNGGWNNFFMVRMKIGGAGILPGFTGWKLLPPLI